MKISPPLSIIVLAITSIAAAASVSASDCDPSTHLWYQWEVKKWEDALPIGNGRLGGMYFGGVAEDRLQFNEDTYWSGGPYDSVPVGAYKHLDELRELLFANRVVEGHLLFGRYFLGYPVEQQKYQCMGNVVLTFPGQGKVSDYRRELDLRTAMTRLTYEQNGIKYVREAFASHPDQAIVMRITADKPGAVSFECQLRGVRNQTHSNYATDYFHMDLWGKDGLKLTGKSADYLGVEGKLRYEARLKARVKGGKVWTNIRSLNVENADEVVLILVAATNFKNYRDVSGDCTERVETMLSKLAGRTYEQMKKDHVKDHQRLLDRVKLELEPVENSFLPTDVRKKKVQNSPDPALAGLAYQFGRYIMIASSRPGAQPANLQGVWNEDQNPSWDSKYTTNINTEMNYWSVDSGNLSECSEPLFRMIKELTDQGRKTARELYGAKRGWVFHQNTDLWRRTTPMDGSNWGGFTVGGAWLCTHIWEHYQYTRDREFLKEYYPVMKGAAEFFVDFLVPHPNDGYLVTCPSTSPENPPAHPGNYRFFDEMNGTSYIGSQLTYGSTIDRQILFDLFGYVAEASQILGVDEDLRREVLDKRSRLAPMKIGKDGSLQEWYEDWGEVERHRHFSHMYGMYPGNCISPVKTPELLEPCKKVMNQRGDESSGWSRAWKMCEWARMFDGDRARKIFLGYLEDQATASLFAICAKAMQVDGAFGVTAGITEMLMQSHEGYIELLPALPKAWDTGRFSGVTARGAFELDYGWDKGKVTDVRVLSKAGGTCALKCPAPPKVSATGSPITVNKIGQGVYGFESQADQTYKVVMN